MARKAMTFVLAAALAATGLIGVGAAPASADGGEFNAPVSGTVLVPYWLDTVSCIGCNPDSVARQTLRTAGYDQPILNGRDYIEVCDKPTPPGAFHMVGIGAGGGGLSVEIAPTVDWDVAICGQRGPNGEELRADPTDVNVRWREDGFGANVVGEPCPNPLGVPEAPIGCKDAATVSVGGWPNALIGYNWSDIPTCPFTYNRF